jgi:ribosomal protein S24E
MGSTTGLGLVYSDKESMKVEPSYMHERYAELRSASAEPEEAAAETEDVSGGEE